MIMSSDHPHLHSFTREQKVGFSLLLLFGVLTVGLGFLQIRNTIYNPLAFDAPEQKNALAGIESDPNVRLQAIDTDQDGLSDYDELNFYSTSPYLPDSDSDGKTDKQEIEAGTDPNCAEGKLCVNPDAVAKPSSDGVGASPLVNAATAPLVALDKLTSTIGATTTMSIEGLLKNPSALRSILISSGNMSATDLADVDDETLIRMFSEIVEKESRNLDKEDVSTVQSFISSTTIGVSELDNDN